MAHKKEPPGRVGLEELRKEADLFDNPMTDKQRDILAAAERLFSSAGYTETPTAAIAREAGVTEKTLFKHFPTKADLFRRILFPILMRTFVPLQFAKVRNVVSQDYPTYAAMFTALARDRWRTAREMGTRMRFGLIQILSNDGIRRDMGHVFHENPWRDLVAAVKRMQETGRIRTDVPAETIARVQIAVIGGYAAFRAAVGEDYPIDEEREVELMAKVLADGIVPKPVPR